MKIKGLLIIVICMIGLSGCTSKGFDIERVYQFVEIQSSNGKEIGTIVNSDDLEFFFEEMKFQEWKYIEEKEDFAGMCRKYGLDLISMIAPTSEERISMIAEEAGGFIYCVSSLGVTGVRSNITTDIGHMISLVKKSRNIPCAVGFGISTPEQAAEMSRQCDGVIVGSAIVKLCGEYGKNCVPYIAEYVKKMKEAVQGIL